MEKKHHPLLHGKKLATILEELIEAYGWKNLASRIEINCFKYPQSIPTCVKFLRKNPWAKEQLEKLYIDTME